MPFAPSRVYHYTSQDGFLGILGQQEIWATHFQYLNDTSELSTAVSVAKSLINKRIQNVDDVGARRLERITSNFERFEGVNFCVASFCENGDDLGQWRAYAGGIGGISIGFEKTYLSGLDGFVFKQCIYQQTQHVKLMNQMLDSYFLHHLYDETLWNRTDQQSEEYTGISKFFEQFLNIALTFKDQAFEGEQEWRLINKIPLFIDHLSIRPGKSNLIPYYVIKLKDLKKGLADIYVGPSPDPTLSLMPIMGYCHKVGAGTGVSVSRIPYREW